MVTRLLAGIGRSPVAVLIAIACGALAATPIAVRDPPASAERRLAPHFKPADRDAESLLIVHYRRADGDYSRWNLWVWPEHGEGRAFPFSGVGAHGRYAVVPFTSTPPRAGFIVRRGEWEEKDFDQDRFVALQRGSVTEIWLVSGEETVHTSPGPVEQEFRVTAAFLDDLDRIQLATTVPLSPARLRSIRVEGRPDAEGAVSAYRVRSARVAPSSGDKPMYQLEFVPPVAPEDIAHLTLSLGDPVLDGLPSVPVFARDVLQREEYSPLDAELGARCTPTETRFATWSPVADQVELLLDDAPVGAVKTVPLARGDQGVWSVRIAGDLHGVPYRYRFHRYGEAVEAADVHGFAATADSAKSVVADLERLKPADWDDIEPPSLRQPTDEVIYEIHVRDFTSRDDSCPSALRGTYLGLLHTKPETTESASRGIAHLRELGVSAVHLLPVHDFTAKIDEYNWGYWTTLFNVPESNYASDRADPLSAIRDLRAAIAGLHKEGIRVILDVVYNHTSDAGPNSPFGAAVPYYYFRTTPDGRLINETGVGNTIADERPMVRKYILDSLVHWARAYKVDGFRFDLLGTHEPGTVRALLDRLDAERSDLTLYGEPWTGGGRIRFGKGAQRGSEMAVFNDHLRNAIRGDLDGTAVGFATGPGGDDAAIRRGITGAIDDFTDAPGESINYASAHDNLTLWDKIVKTQPGASEGERRAMQRLALGIVLTSQGIAFLHGGSEFCRTKDGHHNTYNAGDAINRFDWERKRSYDDVFDYVAGLIRLRRDHPAFRMTEAEAVRTHLRFLEDASMVAFWIDGTGAGDSWDRILVAYNDEPVARSLALPGSPDASWTLVVDAARAGTDSLAEVRGRIELPPYSMIVAHRAAAGVPR